VEEPAGGDGAARTDGVDVMAELDERIARLQQLLSAPELDADEAVLRHHLCQLRQLRAEMSESA
jgi:hypothetical protein